MFHRRTGLIGPPLLSANGYNLLPRGFRYGDALLHAALAHLRQVLSRGVNAALTFIQAMEEAEGCLHLLLHVLLVRQGSRVKASSRIITAP